MSSKEEFDALETKVNLMYTHFDRIEEKVNYIINLLEILIETDIEEDEDDDDMVGNEGWITDLDAWKDSYEDD